MRIRKGNTVGLIIDIQERLFPVMDDKETLLKNSMILIEGLQELSVPLLISQQYTKGLGETIPELKSVIKDFSFIEKTTFSCYEQPAFIDAFNEVEKTNIIICGIESHVCVLQTAIDLKSEDYNPIVVYDCISSRNRKDKELALERFRHEGIIVTGYESILFELTRGAQTPEFKSISKLVK